MRIIAIDGSRWSKVVDFYRDLLASQGPQGEHGLNVNAFVDSMIYGGMLDAVPPYEVMMLNVTSPDIQNEVRTLSGCLAKARNEFRARRGEDIEVTLALNLD